jgi:hypothetical protein
MRLGFSLNTEHKQAADEGNSQCDALLEGSGYTNQKRIDDPGSIGSLPFGGPLSMGCHGYECPYGVCWAGRGLIDQTKLSTVLLQPGGVKYTNRAFMALP